MRFGPGPAEGRVVPAPAHAAIVFVDVPRNAYFSSVVSFCPGIAGRDVIRYLVTCCLHLRSVPIESDAGIQRIDITVGKDTILSTGRQTSEQPSSR